MHIHQIPCSRLQQYFGMRSREIEKKQIDFFLNLLENFRNFYGGHIECTFEANEKSQISQFNWEWWKNYRKIW